MNDRTRDALLMRWMEASKFLAVAVEEERTLRKEVAALLFPNPVEGMNNVELGAGYTIKLDFKYNYKLVNNEKAGKLTEAALAQLIAASPPGEGALLGKRLVKWSPELSISEWRKLTGAQQACFGNVAAPALIITPPGLPSLKLEPPKAAK